MNNKEKRGKIVNKNYKRKFKKWKNLWQKTFKKHKNYLRYSTKRKNHLIKK
jgi:hypothetical protein